MTFTAPRTEPQPSIKTCKAVIGSVLATLLLAMPVANAADWPSWCGQPSRNMASATEKGLPSWFDCPKENAAGEIDPATTKNVKWVAKLGANAFGSPVVSQGKVFIGGGRQDTACLLCLDEKTGRELGRFICQRPAKDESVARCMESWGVCSTPTVEDDRLYFVSPYQQVLCLDLHAWLSGAAAEKSIVWQYDLAKDLKAVQQHTAACSVLVHGDFVYVCTGNGRWMVSSKPYPYYPLAPSLVAFNKKTGQLVARDDEQIGERLWRGQWSSPSLGVVDGKEQIYFGAGDGVCYAFEPVDPNAPVVPNRLITTTLRGPIVQFVDVAPKKTKAAEITPPAGAAVLVEVRPSIGRPVFSPLDAIPTAQVPDVPVLKKIWWCDCIPPAYRKNFFYAGDAKSDGNGRPCEIMATPVFYRNRVYVAIGGDPHHGGPGSLGNLVCMEAAKTGDITQSGRIWSYDKINQSAATLAIAYGLVFALDESNVLHCLDAETGQCYWTYEKCKNDMSSPLVADGKVFTGKAILSASKEFKLLTDAIPAGGYSTPCVANGVLFLVHDKRLWAIGDKGDKP